MPKATDYSPRRAKLAERWVADTKARLAGRKIVDVRWMGDGEIENCSWRCGAVVLILDDGSILTPQANDEGNDAGALMHATEDGQFLMPVF